MNLQRPRSSLNHHSSVGSLDSDPISSAIRSEQPSSINLTSLQSSIQFLYRSLRQHLKEKKLSFQEPELKDMYRAVSGLMKGWTKIGQANEEKLGSLRKQFQKMKIQKDKEISRVINEQIQQRKMIQEDRKLFESVRNQRILDMSAEFTRKQQSYKQLLSGFMQALTKSQKIYSSTLGSLNNRLMVLSKQVSSHLSANDQQKQIADMINRMLDEMKLRRQNSGIQKVDDDEASRLFEDEDGDEHDLGQEQDLVCPIGQDLREHLIGSPMNTSFSSTLDSLLQSLVLMGFFLPCNSKNVSSLQSLSATLTHCRDLLQHPKYPAILEMIRLELGEQQASMLDEGSVIMRNIEHVDQLSIRE